MRRVFLDKCLEAKCRENPGKSGLEPTAPSRSEDIALYHLSHILNYKTDGSLVNFRRMPFQSTQKTTEDVDNGHSKECRAFDVDQQRQHFQDSVPRRVYAGQRRCFQAQSHPEHAAAKCEHHRLFFWSKKKGGGGVRPHPPNPPWLRAWGSSAPSEPPLATCLRTGSWPKRRWREVSDVILGSRRRVGRPLRGSGR